MTKTGSLSRVCLFFFFARAQQAKTGKFRCWAFGLGHLPPLLKRGKGELSPDQPGGKGLVQDGKLLCGRVYDGICTVRDHGFAGDDLAETRSLGGSTCGTVSRGPVCRLIYLRSNTPYKRNLARSGSLKGKQAPNSVVPDIDAINKAQVDW